MTEASEARAIGRLEAQFQETQRQFQALEKRLEDMALIQKETAEESREGRRRIYDAQDESNKSITQMRVEIKSIKEQMAVDKPVLDGISRWKERIIGMQMLTAGVAAAVGGATMLFWKWIAIKIGLQ